MDQAKGMLIARVIARLNVGGPAIQAILMTETLGRRGFRTLLLTGEVAPGEASMDYFAASKGVTPVKLNTMSRQISIVKDLASLWKLCRIFIKEKPVIVHTHTAKAGTLGRIAAVLAGVPVRVHTFHGHVFKGYFSPPLTRAFVAIERTLAKFTDCIVTVSESQKRELCEEFKIASAEKVKVVELGFELDPFLETQQPAGTFRHALACTGTSPLVGWIGRFVPVKAPNLFIQVVRECTDNLARFVMVGDGELRVDCQAEIARHDLSSRIQIVGWRRDLPEIYSDLDLVVCTSINEGTPVALLEAMASGKAFVATDAGGVRDLMLGTPVSRPGMQIFENGVLVERNPAGIARSIEYLLQRPELRVAMGARGREFVRSRFSVQRLTDDLEHLYLQLIAEKGLPSPSHKSLLPISPSTIALSQEIDT